MVSEHLHSKLWVSKGILRVSVLRYTWVAEFLLWVANFVADGCICLVFACFGFCLGVGFVFFGIANYPKGGKNHPTPC